MLLRSPACFFFFSFCSVFVPVTAQCVFWFMEYFHICIYQLENILMFALHVAIFSIILCGPLIKLFSAVVCATDWNFIRFVSISIWLIQNSIKYAVCIM